MQIHNSCLSACNGHGIKITSFGGVAAQHVIPAQGQFFMARPGWVNSSKPT
jgi:hypothetical protein